MEEMINGTRRPDVTIVKPKPLPEEETPRQEPEKKPKKGCLKRIFKFLLILLLMAASAVGGGYAYYAYDKGLIDLPFLKHGTADEQYIADLTRKAENGDVAAMTELGRCYLNGERVEKNPVQAYTWCKAAAEKGNAEAMFNLSTCYAEGIGITKNAAEAFKWCEKSANKNYVKAQSRLGDCYYEGLGTAQDYKKAVEWYTKAAQREDARAQYGLGICYLNGQGTEKDESLAMAWFSRSSKQGFGPASRNMGDIYVARSTSDSLKTDSAKLDSALYWYQMGSAQGDAFSQNYVGDWRYNKGEYAQAVELYKKAAAQGNHEAEFSLGYCFEKGHGVEKNVTEALAHYRVAADHNHAKAFFNMGCVYEEQGKKEEAFKCYQKAADLGNANAKNNLAYCYLDGVGTARNAERALALFREAAAEGNDRALTNLGDCYLNGKGVPQDYKQALEWFLKAADAGSSDAMNRIGDMYDHGQGVLRDVTQAAHWHNRANGIE